MTENNTPFIEDNDQTRARREHLDRIQALTGNAYPNKFRRSNVSNNQTEGEDTITSIVSCEAITQHVPRLDAGARPTAEQLSAANEALKAFGDVRVSGRLAVPPRVMGKAAFVHLSDGKERLQIYVRRDDVQGMNHAGRTLDGWELFSLLDHGDFIGVEGFLFVTKTGELSVHVRSFEFLAKALLPMPDKMHGISDPEIRQRQRYADLIAGSLKIEKDDAQAEAPEQQRELTPREVFERRSKVIREMRAFLDERGYIEVETPMLTPIASGAAARPFKTHHNALDIDLYARIAPELYLKRLLVGGFERVYELNRNFRNEGISARHNPEFTMLEFYCAYMDVSGMINSCEELLRATIKNVLKTTKVSYNPERRMLFPTATSQSSLAKLSSMEKGEAKKFDFDFSQPLHRLTMKQAIGKYWLKDSDLSVLDVDGETFKLAWLDDPRRVRLLYEFRSKNASYKDMAKRSPRTADFDSWELDNEDVFELEAWRYATEEHLGRKDEPRPEETASQIVFLFEDIAERHLLEPTFITDFPKIVSPLSKASPDEPSIAERFELYIAGMECANGFSELNDPLEQYERFKEQTQARERGDEEAMQMDTDYVRALAYGMPPAAGIGIGIDRLVMLLTNRRSIRDVILFPHMRPAAPKTEEATVDGQAASTDERAGVQEA